MQDGLPEAFPYTHPGPGPDHGAHDQRWEAGEPVEAGRDVAGGAHDADEERDDQAGGDGRLGVEPEAEDQQRYRQRRATDAYQARQGPRADPPEEGNGALGSRGAPDAFPIAFARARRGSRRTPAA